MEPAAVTGGHGYTTQLWYNLRPAVTVSAAEAAEEQQRDILGLHARLHAGQQGASLPPQPFFPFLEKAPRV